MVQSVTYQSEKQSVYFRYYPRMKRTSEKEKSKITYMMCSVNTRTDFTNQPQHCCPGLPMV